MSDEPQNLRRAIDDLAADEQRTHVTHLSAEEVTAYARGELPESEEKRAQDHLVWCRRCTQRLLASPAFGNVAAESAARVSDPEVVSAWEKTKAAVGLGRSRHRPERRRLLDAFDPVHAPYAVAASLLIALAVVGAWSYTLWRENRRLTAAVSAQRAVTATEQSAESRPAASATAGIDERQIAELRQQVALLSEPQPNVFIADLYPADATRGPGDNVTTLDVPAGASLVTVILNTADDRRYGEYQIEVLDRTAARIWRGDGLQKTPFGNFTLALPRRQLPAGEYRLELRGVASGQATLLEQYRLRIRYR